MKVKELMSPSIISIRQDDSIEALILLMWELHISGTPVTNESGEYVGLISQSDLASPKILDHYQQHQHLAELKVQDIMTNKAIIAIDENEPIINACNLFRKYWIHRLLVKNKAGEYVGVLSVRDLINAQSEGHSVFLDINDKLMEMKDALIISNPLSDRQQQILRLYITGKTADEMATIFHTEVEDVTTQMRAILEKLSASSLKEAAEKSIENNLIYS